MHKAGKDRTGPSSRSEIRGCAGFADRSALRFLFSLLPPFPNSARALPSAALLPLLLPPTAYRRRASTMYNVESRVELNDGHKMPRFGLGVYVTEVSDLTQSRWTR